MKRKAARWLASLGILWLAGCASTGNLGLVTKSSADPAAILRNGRPYRELGPAQGRSCRYFLLGVIPWGNADINAAVDKALRASGGDALINVTTSNSLYGLIPLYNLFCFACTEVKGTAVAYQ